MVSKEIGRMKMRCGGKVEKETNGHDHCVIVLVVSHHFELPFSVFLPPDLSVLPSFSSRLLPLSLSSVGPWSLLSSNQRH